MPTITVMAPDSALAMDEVVRQLGDSAYILSTTQKDGMIQIKATNEPTTSAPQRLSAVKTVFEDGLERQASARIRRPVTTALAAQLEPAVAENETERSERPALVAVDGGLMRETPRRAKMPDSSSKLQAPQAQAAVFSSSRGDLGSEQDEAAPPPDSPAAKTVPERASAPRVRIQEEGVDAILNDFGARVERLEASLGLGTLTPAPCPEPPTTYQSEDFVAAGMPSALASALVKSAEASQGVATTSTVAKTLAREMVTPPHTVALDADILFVVGASGSGKTTLAAKFAALLRETREERTVSLVSLEDAQTPQIDLLSSLARLINVPTNRWMVDQLDRWSPPRDGETLVVDLACSQKELAELWPDVQAKFENYHCHVVLALGSGLSNDRIFDALEAVEVLKPEIVLTKLDEFECALPELCTIVEQNARIGWLAGTRSLVGNLAQATSAIMEQYLQGCISASEARGSAGGTEQQR